MTMSLTGCSRSLSAERDLHSASKRVREEISRDFVEEESREAGTRMGISAST